MQARIDRLAELLEERLDIRGKGFEQKLRRAGRLLPRHLRIKGRMLVDANAHADHPRLLKQLDDAALELAAQSIERYLLDIDPWDRRRGIVLNWGAGLVFRLLVLIAAVLAFLKWQAVI